MVDQNISQDKYIIQTLDEKFFDVAKQLLIKTFCDDEPICQYLQITYEEFAPFAEEVIKKAVQDGVSHVALNEDQQVVAFSLAEDIAEPITLKIENYPRLQPIFEILESLSAPFMENRKFKKNIIIHPWIAGVHHDYIGMSLSKKIVMTTMMSAAANGYKFAYGEFTNPKTERIMNGIKNAKLCNKIEYHLFIDAHGNRPFAGLEGHTSAYLASISPDVRIEDIDQYI